MAISGMGTSGAPSSRRSGGGARVERLDAMRLPQQPITAFDPPTHTGDRDGRESFRSRNLDLPFQEALAERNRLGKHGAWEFNEWRISAHTGLAAGSRRRVPRDRAPRAP
jgi:hypothetical protein